MKIKLLSSLYLETLEQEVNEMLEQLKKEDLYVQDVELAFPKYYSNEYVCIIKYQEKIEDKVVGKFYPNGSCLD